MSGSAGGWYTPGWYDDGHGAMRWWDGQRWTEHIQPAAPASPAAPEIPPVPANPAPPPSSATPANYATPATYAAPANYATPATYAAPAIYAAPATDGTPATYGAPGTYGMPGRPAGGGARRRGWLIALAVAGGLVVLSVIVVVAVTLMTRSFTSSPPGASGVVCWDGSDAVSSDACPAFEGEDALWYAFELEESPEGEAADCEDVEASEYSPAGATTVLACSWSDLPGLIIYLASYPSTSEAQSAWDDYYSDADSTDWLVDDERIGTVWDLVGSTEDGESYWSTGTLYDDLPVGAEYFSFAPDGSRGSIDAGWERVKALGTESIDEIVDATQ